MIPNDFIMRMIAQFARALARIFQKIRAGQHGEAMQEINETYQRACGLTSELIGALPDASLVELMKIGGRLDTEKCVVLAELLRAEGECFEHGGEPEKAFDRRRKALNLLLEVSLAASPPGVREWDDSIQALVLALSDYDLPDGLVEKLVRHDEATGQYALAEDALFDLLESSGYSFAAIDRAIAFYERLSRREDAELRAGNLTRAEVEEELARLRDLREQAALDPR